MFGLTSTTGSATADFRYCSQPVPAKTACPSNSGIGNYIANIAQYAGSWTGTVSVCERTMYNGGQQSRACAFDYAWSSAAYITSGNEYLVAGNDSPWRHTIYGDAQTPSFARAARASGESASAGRPVDRATLPDAVREEVGVLRSAGSEPVTTIARPDDQVKVTATSEDLVCVRSTLTDAGACQTPENTVAGGLLSVSVCSIDKPDDTLGIYGVVPDGVTAVEIVTGGGEALKSSAVVSNTFRLDLPKADAGTATGLRWVGVEGGRPLGEILPTDLAC